MKHAQILIVEDDADTADMLNIFFSSQGSVVETVPTGEMALSIANEKQPDLIILDIMLPDMDGFTVCRKLRSSAHSRHIPILFLTQKNTRRDILSGLEIGADDYLTKPFDLEELRLRVRNALRRSRTYRQIDTRTSLPTGDLIRSTLSRRIMNKDWAALLVRISGIELQHKGSQPLNQDELLRKIADWLENILHEIDNRDPFVGYLSDGDFLLVTHKEHANQVKQACSTAILATISKEADPEARSDSDKPVQIQLPLAAIDQTTGIELEIGMVTADDGQFENVETLLDALFDSINARNETSAPHVD